MPDFINTIDVLGDDAVIDSIIDRTITEFNDDHITEVGQYAFYQCAALTAMDLPNVTEIGVKAFARTSPVAVLNLPKLTILGNNAFEYASFPDTISFPSLAENKHPNGEYCFENATLKNVDLPICKNIAGRMFRNCTIETINMPNVERVGYQAFGYYYGRRNKLTTVDLPVCNAIEEYAFDGSQLLTALILRADVVCANGGTKTFNDTPIAKGTGYIYVPRALVDSYKAATNWSTYASQFRALEDYTVNGTITGALDETKI